MQNAKTVEEVRKGETELILLRSKVNNQVLIKNFSFSKFIEEINVVFQSILLDAMKRSDENVFTAYMIDFTWKVVQVKVAFMVRQLNYKVTTDIWTM